MTGIPNELIEAVRSGTASDINIAAVDAARASLPGNGQNGVRLASEVRRLTCEAIVAERETRPHSNDWMGDDEPTT